MKADNYRKLLQQSIKALAQLFLKLLSDLKSIEEKLLSLLREYLNYRKQLLITRDVQLPCHLEEEFPDLRALLSIKVNGGLEKLKISIVKLLDIWQTACDEINTKLKKFENDLNLIFNPTSTDFSSDDMRTEELQTSFEFSASPEVLYEASPSSFSPIKWYEHFARLSQQVDQDYLFWRSHLKHIFSEPLEIEVDLESVPDNFESLKHLCRFDTFFAVYMEFN